MKIFSISLLKNFCLRVLYLVFIAFIVISFGSPIYGTTDDYILSSFVDGNFTGQSEKISIFIEPLISSIIYILECMVTSINFYSLFLLSITLISLSLFGTLMSELKSSIYLEMIWIFLSSGFTIWFALNPTYTASSMFSSAVNLTSLMILLSGEIKLKKQNILIITTSGFFALSYLIRPESSTAVIGIFSIFLIINLFKQIKSKNVNYKNYLLSIFIIIFITTINSLLSQNLKNHDWDTYDVWNSMRHQIQQRLSEDQLLEMRSEIGWTVPEYHLFMNLAFGDPNKFNAEWIEPAFNKTQEYRGINSIVNLEIDLLREKLQETYKKYKSYFILNLIFLLIIISLFKFTRNNYLFLSLSVFQIILIIIYMSISLHTPERVIVPLMLFPLLICIYSLSIEKTDTRKRVSHKYIAVIVLVVLVTQGLIFFQMNSQNKIQISQAKLKNEWLQDFDNSAIYIGPVGTETYHLTSPYKRQNLKDLPTIFTTGNWETFSPHWFQRIKYLKLNQNSIYESLFDKNVFWISYPQPDNAYLVELYLNENKYPAFTRINKKVHDSGLSIYQFIEE